MATKVYTSGEFKRERDNFLSLCKNLERADTKRWLSEVRLNIVFALFGRRDAPPVAVGSAHLPKIRPHKSAPQRGRVIGKCP
jgi:hypothetical protein